MYNGESDNFYHDDFLQQQNLSIYRLKIDKIKSYYTEERRISYYTNPRPEIELDKMLTFCVVPFVKISE